MTEKAAKVPKFCIKEATSTQNRLVGFRKIEEEANSSESTEGRSRRSRDSPVTGKLL